MKRHLRLPFKGDYEKNKENLEWMAKYPEGSFIPTKPRIISKADTLDTYSCHNQLVCSKPIPLEVYICKNIPYTMCFRGGRVISLFLCVCFHVYNAWLVLLMK